MSRPCYGYAVCRGAAPEHGGVDSIYRNGAIITLDDAMPVAEAVAVTGGRIVAVGDAADVNAPGGTFRRRAGSSEPNGVAEEYAFFQLLGALAINFDESVNDNFIMRGTKLKEDQTIYRHANAAAPAAATASR